MRLHQNINILKTQSSSASFRLLKRFQTLFVGDGEGGTNNWNGDDARDFLREVYGADSMRGAEHSQAMCDRFPGDVRSSRQRNPRVEHASTVCEALR